MDEITLQKRRIQRLIAKRAITKAALARKAGIGETRLIGMERPNWNPLTETLAALVRAADQLGFSRRPRGARAAGSDDELAA